MQGRIWWVSVTGTAEGPLAADEIAAQHAQGRVGATTPVWRDGMAEWLPADRTELAPIVTAVGQPAPPPVAPSAGSPPPPSPHRPPAAQGWVGSGPAADGGRPGPPQHGTWQQPTPSWQQPTPSWQQPAPSAASTSNGLSTAAIVCGIISLLFFPIILGPAGIICAGVAMGRGEPRARVAMGVAIGGMVLGFIIGAVVWSSM